MSTLSTRTLTALAFERGEEFDPALTPSATLAEDLALIAGARPLICERPRRRRAGARRDSSAKLRSAVATAERAAGAQPQIARAM